VPNFSCGCASAERTSWCQDSRHRALENYFPVRICYVFIISRCGGNWHLNLCTVWVLVFRNLQSDGKIWFFLRAKRICFGSRFCSAVLFLQVPKKCTDLNLNVLYNLILPSPPHWIRSTKISFQDFQIFQNILLNLTNFQGGLRFGFWFVMLPHS